MFARLLSSLSVAVLVAAASPGQRAVDATRGRLFDRVVDELQRGFYDRDFTTAALPALAERFRPSARAASDAAEERAVVHALLAKVPASHLALLSDATYEHLENELFGRDEDTFGLQLLEVGGRFFVDSLLDGGPAQAAGLQRGDRVLSIDGRAPGRSPRLDWRADDAHLPDLPVHDLLATAGDKVSFVVEPTPDAAREVEVVARPYSALRASKASIAILEHDGQRLGYVHLWFVFDGESVALLRRALRAFAGCDGVIVDLRGRGGSGLECAPLVALLQRASAGLPLAALIDARTRSAKEIIAFEFQQRRVGILVGEATAGAVVPASFAPLDHGAVLMYPRARLSRYSDLIEGCGVAPDIVAVDRPLFANGSDPILMAAIAALAPAAPPSAKAR